MPIATAIVLGVFGAFAVSVVLRLRRAGAGAFDDRMSPADRRLVGASAFYLAVPATVLASQVAQVGALELAGGRLDHLETYVYWGVVHLSDPAALTPLGRAGVAAAGPLTLIAVALIAVGATLLAPANAARNLLRLELARIVLLLVFAVHPAVSLVTQRGDFYEFHAALEARHPRSGDLALLGYGILAAYAFFRWRSAKRLYFLATPLYDAARLAQATLTERPGDAEALRTLGTAQLAAGDRRAMETLRRARVLSPGDPKTALVLGRAHLARGEALMATEHLRHAGQLLEDEDDPDPADEGLLLEVTLALSAARIALGDAEGACEAAAAARDRAPADPRSVLLLADALVASGRRVDAEASLEAALGGATGRLRGEVKRRLTALRRRR